MMMKSAWHLLYFYSPNWQQPGVDMSLHTYTFNPQLVLKQSFSDPLAYLYTMIGWIVGKPKQLICWFKYNTDTQR
jgi:hypothetical protein